MFEVCPSPGRGLLTVHYLHWDAGVRKGPILPSVKIDKEGVGG